MPFTKIAIAGVVVCLAGASVVEAQGRRGQGRGRDGRDGRDGRASVQRRVVVRSPVVVQRHVAPRRVAPYGYGHSYGGRFAYRPVYRPRIGFGIYIGSPYRYGYAAYGPRYYARPYPYSYGYGYGAPYPYAYPYQSYGSHGAGIYAAPPQGALYGGVRLDVEPRDAAVYVDGYYAGIVDDFDGAWQRIALEPGPHRFEVVAPGLETLTFEVNVRPDQTVHYRGDMLRVGP